MSERGPIRGVPIFEQGTHRDKPYGPRDLADMVRNFSRYSVGKDAILPVPTVLGHEEDQQILQRSDQPSVGWPDRVYTGHGKRDEDGKPLDPKTLYADYDEPPDVLHKLLANRAYNRVSCEVYDEPPEGHPGTGKALRRIALLGGDQPQIKTLGDILRVTGHGEKRARFARISFPRIRLASVKPTADPNLWVCFSEFRGASMPDPIISQDTANLLDEQDPVPDETMDQANMDDGDMGGAGQRRNRIRRGPRRQAARQVWRG